MKMRKKMLFIALFLSIGLQAAGQSASPSLDNQCRYNVVTPHNGSGVLFDESCSIAYVYPPQQGRAEIVAFAETTNLQFCPAVKSIDEIADRTLVSMNILNELAKYHALKTVIQHQEETNSEPAASYSKQFEENPKKVRALIEKIETDLKDSDAIKRLNDGKVGDEERNKIGDRLKVLDHLREQELLQHLFEIEQEVAALELSHGKRLLHYGVVQ